MQDSKARSAAAAAENRERAEAALQRAMETKDLEALRSGLLVLVACHGECAKFTSAAGITRRFEASLGSLGIRSFNPQQLHQSFAAIGQKGAGKGAALQLA